jgi:hypothetical protein
MSGSASEYNDPQSTAPGGGDSVAGAGADPADSYGGAVSDDSTTEEAPAVAAPGTQNEPAQDMHDASEEDKIAGIVAQTRADVGDQDDARIADVLRQRFNDTGIHVADDRVAALAAEVANR